MTQKDNGGPAFPTTAGQVVYSHGMTLRDWFAGQALANSRTFPGDWTAICSIADWAYQIADAMLAERAK